ncbi:hypothetical protein AB0L35_09975 [Streptomyces sp. NPDC052309]|uniref:hypothetical protein n=1 Tax=Streptomyces sp. NPDC052309 TaxID=3155421 RepID=UPI00342768C2
MVGLRYRSAAGTLIRHYYLIDEARNAEEALRQAHATAAQPAERCARSFASMDPSWFEICTITVSPLGVTEISESQRPHS